MKRGNKVRYKKHLQFIDIENEGGIEMPEGGQPNNNVQKNETIVSYTKDIGIVNYHDKMIYHNERFNDYTPMTKRHLKWAVGRAKNKTKDNNWGITQG
jgi:hypothetical protein